MKRLLSPLVALTAGSAVILGTHPALAHSTVTGGALSGLPHPLLGLDHLVMLMAVGTAGSFISSQVLLWALGGAVIGAAIGFTGFTIVSAEVLAALAISMMGALILYAGKVFKTSNGNATTISGGIVAAAVSIHAMLHGLEAPTESSTLLWWSGALLSSVLVCGGSYLLLKRLPVSVTKAAAVAFLAIGGLLAFGPLILLAGGAGT